MTLKTLADVRQLLKHIPREKRTMSTWQHVEASLSAGDPAEMVQYARISHQARPGLEWRRTVRCGRIRSGGFAR
jgi:hypothetical protein